MENLLKLLGEAEISQDWNGPLAILQSLDQTGVNVPIQDAVAVELIWMKQQLIKCLGHADTEKRNLCNNFLIGLVNLSCWQLVLDFDEQFPLLDQAYLQKQGVDTEISRLSQFLALPNSDKLSPHPLFNCAYYRKMVKVGNSFSHPLVLFFRHSSGNEAVTSLPNPYFDCDWYSESFLHGQPEKHPLLHYLAHFMEPQIQPSEHFDNHFLRLMQQLPDNEDPLAFYINQVESQGIDFCRDGFSPCPYFDRGYYLTRYPDMRAATENGGFDPFHHFWMYGIKEGRIGHAWLPQKMVSQAEKISFASQKKRAVLILGMHRSGTSAITRAINLLGMDLPSGLMEANFANEAGYWESDELATRYHDQILADFDSAWDDILPIGEKFHDSEDWHRFKAALSHYVVKEFHDSDSFVLKDPRMCKLVRLWLEAFADLDVELKVIIPFRHPLAVAGSLAQRDGFSLEKSLLLWADHLLAAEKETRGVVRCFISYDQLLGQPMQVIRQVAEQCRIEWPNHFDAIGSEIEASVDPQLCHQRLPLMAQEGIDAPDWVIKIYRAFEGLTTNAYDAECIRKLDEAEEFVKQMNRFIAAVLSEQENQHRSEAERYRQKHDLIMRHVVEIQKLAG